MDNIVKLGDELICPVCGAVFKVTGDTKYIIAGGYTCSWKCFLKEAKIRAKKKTEEDKKILPRTRKCK